MSKLTVHERPAQLTAEQIEQMRGVPAAIVSDNMSRLFAGGSGLRPVHDGTPLIGMALTVKTRPGDNLAIHKAIDIAKPGDVLVVDAGGDVTNSLTGEIMITLAMKKGLAGFVLDGAVRDLDFVAANSFPVYVRGVTHRGPYKDGPGELHTIVRVGDQVVNPGDLIIGDLDGIIAVPPHMIPDLASKCQAQMARERDIIARIQAGNPEDSWFEAIVGAEGVK
jgi:regulator of RNase E activity RraA